MLHKIFKNMLLPSILLLIVSVSAFLFLYATIDKKNKELLKAQTEWQTETKKFDDIKQLERSMKAIESERALLQKHFAKSSDAVPFLDSLEMLASSVSVESEIASVDVPKNNSSLTVLIRSTGSFANLYKFLTLLENSAYELEFLSVDIQKVGGLDVAATAGESAWESRLRVKLVSFLPK